MGISALMMAVLPFGYFTAIEVVGLRPDLMTLMGFVGVSAIAGFALFLGLCYQAQRSNCKDAQNIKTVAANAGIATALLVGFLLVGMLVPGLHSLVGDYFAQSLAASPQKEFYAAKVNTGFWGAFGAAYGVAVGVTMAGSC